MQLSTTNATENGHHLGIEFADFGEYKAWQFSKYNVKRDPILRLRHLWARIR